MTDALAVAVVSARGATLIRAGHPWLFRTELVRGPATDARDGGPVTVAVEDPRGKRLGTATWGARGPIALRVLDRDPGAAPRPLPEIVAERLETALAARLALNLPRDAYRLVHAESDRLPGLIVDRYADAVVVQTTSAAMDSVRAEVVSLVRARLQPRVVVVRDDGSARDFEELPRFAGLAAGSDARVVYRLGDNRLEADLLTDGKTGGFLDQADNQAAVAALAPLGARALDAFTFHGGFALALARRGGAVLALDENPAAVERAAANARRNGLANMTVERANAFDRLRALEAARATFDVVVVDPPALAKRGGGASGLATAARAYKELILRGARLCGPGGLLVACSCSGRMSRALWEETCVEALADAGRTAHVLSRAGAGRDHPELAGVPETGHLKAWIFRLL
ncbi:MAG TPA: methyltransferase domain-containing protein [Polyangia bacterium]|nr:methyltransferase domain-containing protein [Polyangia bacterium]